MSKELLIVFVKNPQLGKAKTRLAATVGKEKALAVYELLLAKTKEETANLSVDKIVYYADFIDENDLWDNDRYKKGLQTDGDLGKKISSVFQSAFDTGYERICIIGSDCYDLTQNHLETAFEALQKHEAVIGLAEDGGYYLLGISTMNKQLFENKNWSTETVASDTIEDFKSLGMTFQELPTLNDIDTEADLGPWADHILTANA
ncbi:TIGR04282 family arsenosugar biosynthesis glycosyltransferase [Roseivirga misakiensis]|uniref:Glycosyltransferase n=1 Tax=Roseivirga misakiensis TaxID=1563681 RepID=A0A1E5T579_9BACT|nr:TIGR04282 family arsenosugar biosynthesis glycosyltransferase [Roseivirga misakiensis]OEK06534.1 glycosyltransferase [Roseivirga misakiensis]